MATTPTQNDDAAAADAALADVAEGWPAEPGNDELARFAASLRANRPRLPQESIARVAEAVFREMDRDQRPPASSGGVLRLTRWRVAFAAAASVAIAGGVWLAVAGRGGESTSPTGGTAAELAGRDDDGSQEQQLAGAQSKPTPAEPSDVHIVHDHELVPVRPGGGK